jgi:hypothetical protein
MPTAQQPAVKKDVNHLNKSTLFETENRKYFDPEYIHLAQRPQFPTPNPVQKRTKNAVLAENYRISQMAEANMNDPLIEQKRHATGNNAYGYFIKSK